MTFFSPISANTAPRGLKAIGIFLVFGACMASLAGATLTFPGTSLGSIWVLNPQAYDRLSPLGRTVGIGFLLLGAILGVAAAGWFKRRVWGWRLAVALIATQVLGGVVNAVSGRVFEGLVGAVIAGALLFYLLQVRVRSTFQSNLRQQQSPS